LLDRRRPLREDLTRPLALPHRREIPLGSSGGVFEGDAVSEEFELVDESTGGAFGAAWAKQLPPASR
jgi:hypothetical protein